MKHISLYLATIILFVVSQNLTAQEKFERKIEVLEAQKERITEQEKEALKEEVKEINRRYDRGKITLEEANELKEKAAKRRALNIENRIAIIDNKIAFLNRNKDAGIELEGLDEESWIQFEETDDDIIFGIRLSKENNRRIKYDKRTTSDIVLAFGLNNALIRGESFSNSPYQYLGSRFFEIGYAWNTRLLRDKGWLRLKYGVSFQFNGLKPTGNRIFTQTGDGSFPTVVLTTIPDGNGGALELTKSKYRMDSFIIPVHFEFGPASKKEYGNYTRYSTYRKFKVGVGGYFGFNYRNIQKIRGETRNDQIIGFSSAGNGENQRTIFGLSSYAGFGDASLYFKYELTQIFPGPSVKQNNISLGLRFDL
ncbi:MAG: hypothetical protein AAGA43_00525 [Bacteroidota bacterium]